MAAPAVREFPSNAAAAPRRASLTPPSPIVALFAVELALGAVYYASTKFPDSAFFVDTGPFWNLDAEANLPTWFSSIQLMAVAVVLGALAWREFRPRSLSSWSLVAATLLFAFLSCDEAAMLHERAAQLVDRLVMSRRHSRFGRTGVWMFVLGPPLALVGVALAVGAWRYLRQDRVALLIGVAGVAVFFGGALGVEAFSNFLSPMRDSFRVAIAVEEVGEMAGVTLVLWAACRLARSLGLGLAPAPLAARRAVTSARRVASRAKVAPATA